MIHACPTSKFQSYPPSPFLIYGLHGRLCYECIKGLQQLNGYKPTIKPLVTQIKEPPQYIIPPSSSSQDHTSTGMDILLFNFASTCNISTYLESTINY